MEEIFLSDKRILYIGIMNWHYEIKFVEKLTMLGAFVDSFHLSFFSRVINKQKFPNIKRLLNNLNKQIFLKKNYDYVLVHYAIQFDKDFFARLRSLNPNARFINFHWDHIEPRYDYTQTLKYFDRVYSFDYRDCRDNPGIQYLPLFYLDEYEEFRIKSKQKSKEIDVLFIGDWKNYERYRLVKECESLCKKNSLQFFSHLHFAYSLQSINYAVTNGIIPFESKRKFLTHEEILNLFAVSNTIIDFSNSDQTGLTMRTFETLGAGKKLITTNKNIIYEPFYNPEYIDVVDGNNLKLNIDFIHNTPNSSLDEEIRDYSIKNYIYKLLM